MLFHTARFVLPVAAFALFGLGFARIAPAQSNPSAPAVTEPDKATDPALKGPEIADRIPAKGKSRSGFGPDSMGKKNAGGRKPAPPMGMSAFLSSLDVLRSAPTPASTRLTADEDARIKAIASDFENSVKSYLDKNRTELDALRAGLSPNDRNMLDRQLQRGGPVRLSKAGFGGKARVAKQRGTQKSAPPTAPAEPGANSTTEPAKVEAAKNRARLVEIYAGRPRAEDVQARIMGVLTPDQLTIFARQLAAHERMDAPRRHAHARRTKAKGA